MFEVVFGHRRVGSFWVPQKEQGATVFQLIELCYTMETLKLERMINMQLNLTNEQYKKMIELMIAGRTYLGDYDKAIHGESEYEEISDLLCSQFEEFKADDIIQYNEENGRYQPTDELVVEVLQSSEQYEGEVFWDTLIYELAIKEIERSGIEENEENLNILWMKLSKEFEENGLNNLTVNLGQNI